MTRARSGYLTNKSYFRLIFALFLVMQIISLLMNMAVCTFLRRWLAEDAKSYNSSVVTSLEASLESMLSELTRLGRSTAKIASQANKMHAWDSFTHEDYVQIRSLAQDFNAVMSIKEAIGSWFYYNRDKNLVIANGDTYRADIYFNKFFPYSQLTQAQFDAMIRKPSQLIGLETQKEWMVEGNDVARQVVPFVISYDELIGQKALLVLNIPVQYLYDMTLPYRSSEKMGLLVADGQRRAVVSWGIFQGREPDVLQAFSSELGPSASLMEGRLDGKLLICLASESAFLNWEIYIAYQKDEFYRKSNILFWSLTAFNLLVTGFGIALSYLMSRRLFSPIYNLLQLLYPQPPDKSRYNEIQLISNRFEEMQQDNQSLTDDLEQMLPEVKNAFLKNLLSHPDFLVDAHNRAFFGTRLRLPAEGPLLLCGLLIRYRQEFLEQFTTEDCKQLKNNVQKFLVNLMERLCGRLEEGKFCVRMEVARLSPVQEVFVLEAADESFRERLRALLEEIVLLFQYDQENIRMHFILGGEISGAQVLCEENRRLWEQGMGRILLEGDSGVLDLMEDTGIPAAALPERGAEKLWNLLQAPEPTGLRALIDELAGKDAQDCMSMAGARDFYSWTLERCCDFLRKYHLDTGTLHPFFAYEAVEAFSLEELCGRVMEAAQATRLLFQTKDMTAYDAYTRFLVEHYADCTLSQESASDFFHISASRFARSFKEEMGATFPKYLTAMRIRKAKELLLSTTMRIDEIAAMVGISNRVTFNRLFKQSEGMSPGQFRELKQGASYPPQGKEE